MPDWLDLNPGSIITSSWNMGEGTVNTHGTVGLKQSFDTIFAIAAGWMPRD